MCQGIGDYAADKKYNKVNLTLTGIPADIPAEATEVHLQWNNITIIEGNVFSRLTQCSVLELDHNEINEIESGAFNGLSKLKDLRLSSNRLSKLSIGTFQGLVTVEELWVNYNRINTIEDNTFANLKKLRIIWLDNNHLDTLTPGMFAGLDSLEHLTLELNSLTKLPADVFSHLPRPLTLGLQDAVFHRTPDNELQCDAELCWLKQEELQGNITWYIYCKYPSYPYKPRCADGIVWDTWICDGNVPFFVPIIW